MSVKIDKDWPKEFGIDDGEAIFFSNEAELKEAEAHTSQVHVLRRAFELLYLDGILCTQNAPLVYFKEIKTIETSEVARLHRKFWNHGGAPILVLVAPNDVHIYSGLVRPVSTAGGGRIPSLVETLDRASSALREFLPAVESGEFFRRNQTSFNPAHRVDRELLDNLQATRDSLVAASAGKLSANVLDALLCRLVFACYLFDREVVGKAYMQDIGLSGMRHLRDVLELRPRTEAKKYLYALFNKLGDDFNGDLFSDDLRAVEAISAIYERFLKSSDKRQGAFYTPRFLAELVIDAALGTTQRLLDQRFLDPACGSGIFLVGLFNRMAEEWKQAHPGARNDHRARELRKLLTGSLCGVDINPTACRITAFSLYLAYLDQLSPRDIQELRQKGHKLPRLVHYPNEEVEGDIEGNIWCGDFFESTEYPVDADLVIGNPPWGSTALEGTPAANWCAEHEYPIPNKQIAAAFVWKAAYHVRNKGRICLVLPHGTLFNHSTTALEPIRHRHPEGLVWQPHTACAVRRCHAVLCSRGPGHAARPGMRMLEEEAEHLPRSIGPSRIGEGASGAAARPTMASSVNDPLLEDRPPGCASVDGTAVGMPAGYSSVLHPDLQVHGHVRPRLRDDLIGVSRVHRLVLIPMEHDCRDDPPVLPTVRRAAGSAHGYGLALPHDGERRVQVVGGPPGEAGMRPDRRVEIGVGNPHDDGRRRTG